jgi:hypothetical protein
MKGYKNLQKDKYPREMIHPSGKWKKKRKTKIIAMYVQEKCTLLKKFGNKKICYNPILQAPVAAPAQLETVGDVAKWAGFHIKLGAYDLDPYLPWHFLKIIWWSTGLNICKKEVCKKDTLYISPHQKYIFTIVLKRKYTRFSLNGHKTGFAMWNCVIMQDIQSFHVIYMSPIGIPYEYHEFQWQNIWTFNSPKHQFLFRNLWIGKKLIQIQLV